MKLREAPGTPARSRTLSQRASLNTLAAGIDYAVRVVIQLLLAPLMLTTLGTAGYGSWQVLDRLIGHATPAGGRPGEALKWLVAHDQSSVDEDRKRRQLGSAVLVWALFIPLVGGIGGVLAWLSPALVGASGHSDGTIRLVAGLLVLNLVLLGVAGLPQAVLQGENLGYRRLGLSSVVLLLGGGITALTLWAGWGLAGVALATIAGTALSGATFLAIVRRQVPWWGLARPDRTAVTGFVRLSWWFLLWNLVMQAIKGSDLIVLGAVAGASAVAVYSLTSLVPQAVSDTVFLMISSTMPGLGGIIGSGDLRRAAQVRAETLALCWLLAAASGATVVAWLPSFLHLWVGDRYDAGTAGTLLICLMVLQLAVIRVDSNVIDLTLTVRAKVLLGLTSVALSAGLAVLLLRETGLGIAGLVAGLMIGRLPLTACYPVLVARLLGLRRAISVRAIARPLLATAALFALATWLRPQAGTPGWPGLVAGGLVTAATFLVLGALVGLDHDRRRLLVVRLRKAVGRR